MAHVEFKPNTTAQSIRSSNYSSSTFLSNSVCRLSLFSSFNCEIHIQTKKGSLLQNFNNPRYIYFESLGTNQHQNKLDGKILQSSTSNYLLFNKYMKVYLEMLTCCKNWKVLAPSASMHCMLEDPRATIVSQTHVANSYSLSSIELGCKPDLVKNCCEIVINTWKMLQIAASYSATATSTGLFLRQSTTQPKNISEKGISEMNFQ